MKVLLLSAYHAASHKYWCDGLIDHFPNYEWTLLTLPPRYFSWRVRGNSLSWGFQQRHRLHSEYDLLITTSMVDLSALRGFVPALANIPTLVYFHENQFAFPLSEYAHPGVEPQVLNLYTALCADKLLFNSEFNRLTFMQGAARLLSRLPDQVPPGLVEQLQDRSEVVPVPLDERWMVSEHTESASCWGVAESDNRPVRIVWCGRHEYDKGPQHLLAILEELERRKLSFVIAILGQQFKNSPSEFALIARRFAHRMAHFGYVETRDVYRRWLCGADVVLSTALHEFQGLAVMEAVAAGCIPVVPARLAYPEWLPAAYLYDSFPEERQKEARAAVDLIIRSRAFSPPTLNTYTWQSLATVYANIFQQIAIG